MLSEGLQIGRRLVDGRIVKCSDLVLSPGDFVDVAVVFDVAMTRALNGHPKLRVHLGLSHVLQLLSKRDIDKVCLSLSLLYYYIVLIYCVQLIPGPNKFIDSAMLSHADSEPVPVHSSSLVFDEANAEDYVLDI